MLPRRTSIRIEPIYIEAKRGNMSKLVKKLERISVEGGQPLGFGAAVNRSKILQMVVIAGVPQGNAGLANIAAEAGADAVLLTIEQPSKKDEALAQLSSTKIEIPWGVSIDTVNREEMQKLVEAGCDYVIFSPVKSSAAALNVEKIGKVLRVDTSLSDSQAKSVNRLSVDAVLLDPAGDDESPLTIQQLMVYEYLAAYTGKHLVAAMPPGFPVDDIESLWGLGVRGVIVDLNMKDPEGRLSQVKEAIQKLPTTRKRRGGKISASLPLATEWSGQPPPEEDDDDEE
jgi:DNA-binding NarL/FixJ family response regulator